MLSLQVCLIWYAPEDIYIPTHFRRIQGSHIETDAGQCVASSYFVIFNNEKLTQTMQETGADFPIEQWENIAADLQEKIKKVQLDKVDYDTCKVIVALMIESGARFEYIWLDNLIHIGGFSDRAGDGTPFVYRGGVDKLAIHLGFGPLKRLFLYLADIWYGLNSVSFRFNSRKESSFTICGTANSRKPSSQTTQYGTLFQYFST